jgi:hypothetical protein
VTAYEPSLVVHAWDQGPDSMRRHGVLILIRVDVLYVVKRRLRTVNYEQCNCGLAAGPCIASTLVWGVGWLLSRFDATEETTVIVFEARMHTYIRMVVHADS